MANVTLVYPEGDRLDYQLSLPSLVGYLRKYGHNSTIVDPTIERMTNDDVILKMIASPPQIIGVSIPFTTFAESGIELLKKIRNRFPNIPIICGGVHATLLPEEIAPYCDAVVIGDGEETFLEIIEKCDNGQSFYDVKGIAYKLNNKIIINENRLLPDLNELPPPAWDLLPLNKHKMALHFEPTKKVMPILSTRGCPFSCDFCSNWILSRKVVRFKDVEKVISEINELIFKYKVNTLLFRDEVFTLNRNRVIQLCEEIIENKLNIEWWCQTRVGLIDDDLLKIMKSAGCVAISCGIESGSDVVLKDIGKKITIHQAKDTIAMIKNNGIFSYVNFIIGHSLDTKETILETMKVADELDADNLGYAIATPYPKTMLREKAEKQGCIIAKKWSDYKTNNITYIPIGLQGYDLKKIRSLALFSFYGQNLKRMTRYLNAQNSWQNAILKIPGLINVYFLSKLGLKYPKRINSKLYFMTNFYDFAQRYYRLLNRNN